jgi:tryptophan-rich sensory protein
MTLNPMSKQALGFFGWLCICFTAAALGAFASAQAGAFYQSLVRPHWAPPGWLFGPVWTVLYILMTISAWLVWRENGFRRAGVALYLFLFQLAVNALWTWLFFVWHLGSLAFAEIVFLWLLILATVFRFWRHSRVAGALLLPYLAWVTLASVLTWAVWKSNLNILAHSQKLQPQNTEPYMRKLEIIEHISLDGVIQHSADGDDFPYSDWTSPYRTPAGRDAMLAAYGGSFDLLLGRRTYPVLLGTGKRFFAEGTRPRSFELVTTKAMPSGIILSNYKVAGPLKTG